MSHRGDFLGLAHDMSRALSDGVVHFWPRDRIVQKVSSMLADAESSSCLHPGQAAKLYGILNFFEQGVYGKVGAGSLWAIKERQYEATTQLTPDIRDNFRYIRAIIRARPQRQLPVVPLPCDRFVCASDAAEEPGHRRYRWLPRSLVQWGAPDPPGLCGRYPPLVVFGLAASRGTHRTVGSLHGGVCIVRTADR